jgi:hypothetical protein
VASVVLVVAATWLFWNGYYWSGLVLGWLMTFFDTVDGKLARVTVQSTTVGHFLDKITDLIHPPIWYIAWGYGCTPTAGRRGGVHERLSGHPRRLHSRASHRRRLQALPRQFRDLHLAPGRRLGAPRHRPSQSKPGAAHRLSRRRPSRRRALRRRGVDGALDRLSGGSAVAGAFLRLTRGPLQSWLRSVTDDDERYSVRVFARRRLPEELRSL